MKLNDIPPPFLAHLKPGSRPGGAAARRPADGQPGAAAAPQMLVDGPGWAATEPMSLPTLTRALPAPAASNPRAPARTSPTSPAQTAAHAAAPSAQTTPSAQPAHDVPALPAVMPFLFELQALAMRESEFDTAATTVLSALAARLQAHRVSLLVRRSRAKAAEWLASSDGIDRDHRVPVQRQLLNAADEVMDRESLLEAPTPPGRRTPPAIALAGLLRGAEVPACLGMAFAMPDGARGALLVELRRGTTMADRSLAQDAALFVGPVLMLKAQASSGWGSRLKRRLRPYDERQRRSRVSTPALVVALLLLAAMAGAFWPSTHHVVAQGRIEGHGQRVVPAPLDGFLASVAVRPGEPVKAGQVLARLDDKEALLQAERTQAERRQFERQYLDALTREDAAATEIARSKLEQARAADELAQSRLSLSRLVAPFDGVVISGDLLSMIGSPVKRGQELMVVAPSQTWRVVAEVDEADIGHVAPGQAARILLASQSDAAASFAVTRVSPVAQASEGRNIFEVEGLLASTDGPAAAQLRPGQRGIVRIEAGERPPAAVWWERASHALRRALWSLMA